MWLKHVWRPDVKARFSGRDDWLSCCSAQTHRSMMRLLTRDRPREIYRAARDAPKPDQLSPIGRSADVRTAQKFAHDALHNGLPGTILSINLHHHEHCRASFCSAASQTALRSDEVALSASHRQFPRTHPAKLSSSPHASIPFTVACATMSCFNEDDRDEERTSIISCPVRITL